MNQKTATLAVIVALGAPRVAIADIAHLYVKALCVHRRSEAIISHVINWNDDPAPPDSVLLENLPRYNWPTDANAGMKLCPKGVLSRVSIKAIVDEDHSRNDGIWVYVDGKLQNAHPISFNSGYGSYSDKVIFSATPEKTILMLECVDGKGCRTSILGRDPQKPPRAPS